ncbi:MAG: M28 family peptidase, partial [Caldithrix sp.]
MKKYSAICLLLLFAFTFTANAQEPIDWNIISKIKAEGFDNSQVMETMFYLTDVHGPRLTSSPNYQAASQWCVDKMTEWGLVNAKIESWGTFGRGWAVERYSIEMLEPQYLNLIAFPKAWTPGTDGTISGQPVLVDIKSEEDFEKYQGTLKGAIIMRKPTREAETHFEADAKRQSEEDLAKLVAAPEPGAKPSWWARRDEFRRRRALSKKINKFLKEEEAAVILEASRREHGTIIVQSGGSYKMGADPALPALTLSIEHYSRIARLLEHDIPVKLEINVKSKFFEKDSLGYNVVGEIAGTDKKLKEQLVMLGGHLDSWHSGTGSTDNAAGCAVALEAVRILKAIGV